MSGVNADTPLRLGEAERSEELGGDEDWLSPHLNNTGNRINPIDNPLLHQMPRDLGTSDDMGDWEALALEYESVKDAAQIRDRIHPLGLSLTPTSSSTSSQVQAESSSFGTHRNIKGATDG